MKFNPDCTRCPRLAAHLEQVRDDYPEYHARPVAPFGAKNPQLLIVGLAPGMHGANASGRPFTGDYAGILLYDTLHRFGFSNRPESTTRDDGLQLRNCRITNAVKCLPPGNKPLTEEIKNCNPYLRSELGRLQSPVVILALGKIAHDAVLRALDHKLSRFPFGHGHTYEVEPGTWLLDSYHCSRYNTQTRRLTAEMFRNIFSKVHKILNINN
ncbi:MAG: uracil-DNA glycosylase [Gammaproteobacteria bacterium]|nr:uracil-DNA glycosylase [Gammaproteobacteria bacterium]